MCYSIYFLANLGKIRTVYEQKSKTTKKCFSACKTQLYSLLVTNADYPTIATFKYTKTFCYVVLKLLRYCEFQSISISKALPTLCPLISKLKVCNLVFNVDKKSTYFSDDFTGLKSIELFLRQSMRVNFYRYFWDLEF